MHAKFVQFVLVLETGKRKLRHGSWSFITTKTEVPCENKIQLQGCSRSRIWGSRNMFPPKNCFVICEPILFTIWAFFTPGGMALFGSLKIEYHLCSDHTKKKMKKRHPKPGATAQTTSDDIHETNTVFDTETGALRTALAICAAILALAPVYSKR